MLKIRGKQDKSLCTVTSAAEAMSNADSVKPKAKGEAEGKMIIANAEVESLKLLRAAIEDSNVRATDYLVAMQVCGWSRGLEAGWSLNCCSPLGWRLW